MTFGTEPAGDGAFTAAGAVRLARADIAGQLSCQRRTAGPAPTTRATRWSPTG